MEPLTTVSGAEGDSQEDVFEMNGGGRGCCSRRCWGHTFNDWTYNLAYGAMGFGGAVGTVGTVVGGVWALASNVRPDIAAIVLGTGVAADVLTLSFACCFIRCKKPEKDLEAQLDGMKGTVEDLGAENKRTAASNLELKGNNDRLEVVAEKAEAATKSQKAMFQKTVGDLKGIVARLKAEKVALTALFNEVKMVLRKAAKETNKFQLEQKGFKGTVDKFSGEVKKLKIRKTDLCKQIDEFENVQDFTDQQIPLIQEAAKSLSGDITFFKAEVLSMKEALEKLDANTETLDEVDDKIVTAAEDLSKAKKDGKETLEEIQKEDKELSEGGLSDIDDFFGNDE